MPSGGNRKASIDEVRSGLISKSGASEGMWAAVCGCIGLACVFSGIWLGDTQAHAILDAPNSVLVMRIFTSVIYLGFLLFVIFFVQKKELSLRSFFAASSVIAYGLFVLGIVPVMYFSLHGVRLYGGDWSWIALFLTKLIGAPLTVGLVCVFAQLRRKIALRFTTLGMFGSFLIYSAVSQLVGIDGTSFTVCAISALLLFVCTAALILGLGPHSSNEEIRTTQSVVGPGVIRRPIKQMLTPGLVIMLLISSVMLGYLRSGYVADSASYQEASVVVLALLFVIPALWQNVRIEHVFFAGLILSTGSILLNPYLGSLSPAVAPVMGGVGTALFEVVVWTLAVWGAHNCTESLLMASASRFVVTIGHLLGSQIMVFGISRTSSIAEGENAAGAIIVFAFLLLLVLLLKNPNLRAPFTMHVSSYGDSGSSGVGFGSASGAAGAGAAAGAASHLGDAASDAFAVVDEASDLAGASSVEDPHSSGCADCRYKAQAAGFACGMNLENTGANTGTEPQGHGSQVGAAGDTGLVVNSEADADDGAKTQETVSSDVALAGGDINELAASGEAKNSESSMTPEEEYEYRYWKHPCQIIVDTYRLTKRENEVLELLARGYTVATMSETLYVSPNTIKMHVRNIYTKLDVHGKQDVISMVELVRQQIAKE